jgi:polyketide cyclase/dehydrase/lipid transport protein
LEKRVNSGPFSIGTIVLGGGAAVLIALILLGVVLPASWEAEATLTTSVPAETLFEHLDSPEGWRRWTPWPDSGVVRTGPEHGGGATMSWSDRELGDGVFAIEQADPPRFVQYRVQVGSSMITEGTIELLPEDGATRVEWRESGDLGRNPLMGYWAFFMGKAQSRALAMSLQDLIALADGASDLSEGSEVEPQAPEQNEAPAD